MEDYLLSIIKETAFLGSSPFLAALLMGFVFTLLPGPMNVAVVHQTVNAGLRTGMFAATACAVGGMIALFIGVLPLLMGWRMEGWIPTLLALKTPLIMVLAAILLMMGWKALRKKDDRLIGIVGIFGYTAISPASIAGCFGFFSVLQAYYSLNASNLWDALPGVLLGGLCAWPFWLWMCVAAGKTSEIWLERINKGCAYFLIAAGVALPVLNILGFL